MAEQDGQARRCVRRHAGRDDRGAAGRAARGGHVPRRADRRHHDRPEDDRAGADRAPCPRRPRLPAERGAACPAAPTPSIPHRTVVLPYLPDPLAIGVSLTGYDHTGARCSTRSRRFAGSVARAAAVPAAAFRRPARRRVRGRRARGAAAARPRSCGRGWPRSSRTGGSRTSPSGSGSRAADRTPALKKAARRGPPLDADAVPAA